MPPFSPRYGTSVRRTGHKHKRDLHCSNLGRFYYDPQPMENARFAVLAAMAVLPTSVV